jgi:hypothetical protein
MQVVHRKVARKGMQVLNGILVGRQSNSKTQGTHGQSLLLQTRCLKATQERQNWQETFAMWKA